MNINSRVKMSWFDKCRYDVHPNPACLREVFYIWPNDFKDPTYFSTYLANLGLLFGIFSLGIVYVMLIGFVCPC
jgi:hypothetical protein